MVRSTPGALLVAHIDGGARGNPGKAGYGVHLTVNDQEPVDEVYGFLGVRTNNVAEYAGLIAALEYALRAEASGLQVRSDSELLVRQIQGRYKVKNPSLQVLFRRAKERIAKLRSFKVEHVYRADNKEADALANRAMDEEGDSGHFVTEEILGTSGEI
jgi:ribonuclease HI